MSPSNSEIAKKIAAFTLKMLSTALLWIGTALLTKLRLAPNAQDWKSTLDQLPTWALITLMVLLPVVWLAVEFIATCFLELRARVLGQAAPRFAEWLTEIPSAVSEVLARSWDSCLACLSRWRFDGRYRKRLAEECQQLHNQTGLLHATANFSLDEAYTELNMASTQYGEISQGLLSSSIRGRESIYGFLRAQEPGTAIALLGRPGGGKTTLLRHLALMFAKNRQGARRLRRRIPIVIELRRITELFSDKPGSEWKTLSLIQVIQQYWKSHAALKDLTAQAPNGWLRRHLAAGRVLIMIDGLDEVPHRIDPARPKALTSRQRVSKWLENEMQREGQRNCLFLVTSRPGGFSEAPLKQRVTVVEVQPMTLAQSEQFIHAFHLGCQRKAQPSGRESAISAAAAKATAKLQQELQSKPHLADLIVNPLLLHMVCLLHYLRGRLPAHRSDLYRETCDVLLNRDLRAPGIEERLRPEDKMAALKPLADYFMRSGTPEAKTTEELLPVITPVFETLNFPARDFFDFVAKDSGLLQEVEVGCWDFAHKTFYEYLTAEHWERVPPQRNELNTWVEQDWWRVTLLFYSSKCDDSPVVAAGLRSTFPSAWSLAFECINAKHRVNSSDRGLASQLLHRALSTPTNKESFVPAALALLDLRMRETISNAIESQGIRRATLVTQAEYQVFLFSMSEVVRHQFIPPHWSNDLFVGDPIEPVLGVSHSQAQAFVQWVCRHNGQPWRLPAGSVGDIESDCAYWTCIEDRGRIVAHLANVQDGQRTISRWLIDNNVSSLEDVSLNSPLQRQFYSGRGDEISLLSFVRWTPAVFRYLFSRWKSRSVESVGAYVGRLILFEVDSALLIGTAVLDRISEHFNSLAASCFDSSSKRRGNRGSDVGKAFFQSLGIPPDDKAFSDFVSNIQGDTLSLHECKLPIARRLFEALADFCERSTPGFPSKLEILRLASVEDYQIPTAEYDNDEKRFNLMMAAARVVSTESKPLEHRRAWLWYGTSLAQYCYPGWASIDSIFIHRDHLLLKMMKDRWDKKLRVWEGILMVRDK